MRCLNMLIFFICILINLKAFISTDASTFKNKSWVSKARFRRFNGNYHAHKKLLIEVPNIPPTKPQNDNSHIHIWHAKKLTSHPTRNGFRKPNNYIFHPKGPNAFHPMPAYLKPPHNIHPCNKSVRFDGVFSKKIVTNSNPLLLRRKNITTHQFNGNIDETFKKNKYGHYPMKKTNVSKHLKGLPIKRYHFRRNWNDPHFANSTNNNNRFNWPSHTRLHVGGFPPHYFLPGNPYRTHFPNHSQHNCTHTLKINNTIGNDSSINRTPIWGEKNKVTVVMDNGNISVNGESSGPSKSNNTRPFVSENAPSINDTRGQNTNTVINYWQPTSTPEHNPNNDSRIGTEEMLDNNETVTESNNNFLTNNYLDSSNEPSSASQDADSATVNVPIIETSLANETSNNDYWVWGDGNDPNNDSRIWTEEMLDNNETVTESNNNFLTNNYLDSSNEPSSASQDADSATVNVPIIETSLANETSDNDYWVWGDGNDPNNDNWIWPEEMLDNNETVTESNNNFLTNNYLDSSNETSSASQDADTATINVPIIGTSLADKTSHNDYWVWGDGNDRISTENSFDENTHQLNNEATDAVLITTEKTVTDGNSSFNPRTLDVEDSSTINSQDVTSLDNDNNYDYVYDPSIADPEAA